MTKRELRKRRRVLLRHSRKIADRMIGIPYSSINRFRVFQEIRTQCQEELAEIEKKLYEIS